jgi:hypothetical protein
MLFDEAKSEKLDSSLRWNDGQRARSNAGHANIAPLHAPARE